MADRFMIRILRRARGDDRSYWQDFCYDLSSPADTVATALRHINARADLRDAQGNKAEPVLWESSCLQQKCGACAMVICGRPALACSVRLLALKDKVIRLEPLRKFPVIADLMVDRSILYQNLKTLKLWLGSGVELDDKDIELAFESSECIQCGCCLEVCPNFYCGGEFFGMNGVPLTVKLLTESERKDYLESAKEYSRHVFEGCGKSLACKDICPRNIDTEKMMVNANAVAVWKRRKKNDIKQEEY